MNLLFNHFHFDFHYDYHYDYYDHEIYIIKFSYRIKFNLYYNIINNVIIISVRLQSVLVFFSKPMNWFETFNMNKHIIRYILLYAFQTSAYQNFGSINSSWISFWHQFYRVQICILPILIWGTWSTTSLPIASKHWANRLG